MSVAAVTITLGALDGAPRVFTTEFTPTLAQDCWMAQALRKAGPEALTPPGHDAPADEFERYTALLVEKLFAADVIGRLLAGGLVEVGTHWSTAAAESNAGYFLDVSNAEDKSALLAALIRVLARFTIGDRPS